MPENRPIGPVILDLSGPQLSPEDRRRLTHPLTGGLIHFARHFESPAQMRALNAEIRTLRPELLISVDHEGGRVQRFQEGFTAIPPMRSLGELWNVNADGAIAEARRLGKVMAAELIDHGIDFSFTPVLDLNHGESSVIGDRAFHRDPLAVSQLATALMLGLSDGGMASVGKHFPGHGYVQADSHHEMPLDTRTLADIESDDMVPFAKLIDAGLDAVMPAHIVFSAIDDQPAGYSRVWLQDILRGALRFDGLIFSDDLGMAGAKGAGDMRARAGLALEAGCDMVLVCNDLEGADNLLATWSARPSPDLQRRAARMRARAP